MEARQPGGRSEPFSLRLHRTRQLAGLLKIRVEGGKIRAASQQVRGCSGKRGGNREAHADQYDWPPPTPDARLGHFGDCEERLLIGNHVSLDRFARTRAAAMVVVHLLP